jgi:Rad52/22 family double-strand break repair protein
MASPELRAKLAARFPADTVKSRQGPGGKKLDYIAGEQVIRRLQEATADQDQGYAWVSNVVKIEKDGNQWVAVVAGVLQISGDAGSGVGAMRNPDPDMALKSANTEALKNAAKNGFGVALELWDADYRATLGEQRRLLAGDSAAMKQAVWKLAKDRLGTAKPTASDVAELFGTTATALQEDDVLKGILEDEGLL